VNCIDTSSAVQFENSLAWLENFVQLAPNGIPPCPTDQRSSEIVIVRAGSSIPVFLGRVEERLMPFQSRFQLFTDNCVYPKAAMPGNA
jgi:hypothetical protein